MTRKKTSKTPAPDAPAPAPDAFQASAAAYDAAWDMFQILAPDGTVVRPEALPSPEQRVHLYRHMRRARQFDERGWVLYRQGRLGVFPPFGGMEASQCGTAAALTSDDWLFPTYRDTGAALTQIGRAHV